MTNSRAGCSSAAISCWTPAMRHPAGRSMPPASGSSAPVSRANSDDLPAPFLPTMPTRSPGCTTKSASSSSTLVPRRRVNPEARITKSGSYKSLALGQLLAGEQQYLVAGGFGLQPYRFQRREGRLEVLALVTDLQHQHAAGRQVARRVLQDAPHQVHAVGAARQ